MHRFVILPMILSLACTNEFASAQTKKTLLLWPDGAPNALGDKEQDKPKLMVSVPEKPNGTAIVIFPGGGYGHLAMGHEGEQISDWFNRLGIATFICDYRHRGKGYGHPAPMQDAWQAIRTVRAKAKQWGIDPQKIGVIGFSAGGHLASTVSNHFAPAHSETESVSTRPDFAILCYPVIALGEKHSNLGSQRRLLGKNADEKLIQKFSNEKQVSKDTPPTFLWSTADDKVVKVENSLHYFAALRKNNIPAALHVFPSGRHGLGMAKGNPSVSQWTTLCENWLRGQGYLPKLSGKITADKKQAAKKKTDRKD